MDKNWQYRIQQHTALPPEGLWDRVANELDQQAATGVSERLQQYQEIPPEEIWDQIVVSLYSPSAIEEQHVTHPVQPAKTRPIHWFKLGAAASILLLIGSFIYWYSLRPTPTVQAVNSQGSTASIQQNNAAITILKDTLATNTEQASSVVKAAPHPTKKVKTNIDSSLLQLLAIERIEPIHAIPTMTVNSLSDVQGSTQTNGIFPTEVNQSYFTITGPNGEIVRVSAKLKSIAPLLSERDPAYEENIDLIIKNSADWKLKLKTWKDRMLQIPLTPAPTNLMNIIELGKLLDEKDK